MGNGKQQATATATATFESGALFGAVTGVALHLATDLELAPKEGEDEVDLAIRLLGDLAEAARVVVAELALANAEIASLKRTIAGHKGLVTRERKRAEALEAQLPARPRRFDVLVKPLKAGELLELIGAAETVELAFVGPEGREVCGLAPRTIGGGAAAWQVRGNRLFLNVPQLIVFGPAPDDKARSRDVGGYALLIDGELAALRRRDPLPIGAGQQVQLKGDVFFG